MRVPGVHPGAEQITPLPSPTRTTEAGKQERPRQTHNGPKCCEGGCQTKVAAAAAAAVAMALVVARLTGKLTSVRKTSAEFDGATFPEMD